MDKEPKELLVARALLKRAENFGHPDTLKYLTSAIDSLLEVISGNSTEVHKALAKRLIVTYRNKVFSEAKIILDSADSRDLDCLGHWWKIMEIFASDDLDPTPEFKGCKEQLFHKWGNRLLATFTPWQIARLKRDLQKKSPLP